METGNTTHADRVTVVPGLSDFVSSHACASERTVTDAPAATLWLSLIFATSEIVPLQPGRPDVYVTVTGASPFGGTALMDWVENAQNMSNG